MRKSLRTGGRPRCSPSAFRADNRRARLAVADAYAKSKIPYFLCRRFVPIKRIVINRWFYTPRLSLGSRDLALEAERCAGRGIRGARFAVSHTAM